MFASDQNKCTFTLERMLLISMATEDKKELAIKIVYFTGIALASILIGFKRTVGNATSPDAKLHNEAVSLAQRALARGTMYSVGGFTALATASYYLFGKKMITESRERHKEPTKEDDIVNLFK